MKNKNVSIRDAVIFILGILATIFFVLALATIIRLFWMLFRSCFTVFILLIIVKIVQMVVKKKKNNTKQFKEKLL